MLPEILRQRLHPILLCTEQSDATILLICMASLICFCNWVFSALLLWVHTPLIYPSPFSVRLLPHLLETHFKVKSLPRCTCSANLNPVPLHLSQVQDHPFFPFQNQYRLYRYKTLYAGGNVGLFWEGEYAKPTRSTVLLAEQACGERLYEYIML